MNKTTQFLKKIKVVLNEHFPDIGDVQYTVDHYYGGTWPLILTHLVRVTRHHGGRHAEISLFDSREILGPQAIKNRINALAILQNDKIS